MALPELAQIFQGAVLVLPEIGRVIPSSAAEIQVLRHKTAIRRNQLSRPVRLALRDGILLPEHSVFDYGCGRGEDVEYLKGMGFKAVGWDPVHYDHGAPGPADVVNLGYVINVIEVTQERKDTLKRAFTLAHKALIVSAQVGYFDDQIARSTEYEDGYLTSRNTFQKYYDQAELKDYIREILGQEPYAAGIGIYYVFKDSQLEAAYCRRLFEDALPEAFQGSTLNLTLSAETLSSVAQHVLSLGRLPEPSEAPELGPALAILSASEGWLKRVSPYLPDDKVHEIGARRKRELLGRLLASYFSPSGKLRMCDLSESERADLRCFFGSYSRATNEVEAEYLRLADLVESGETGQSRPTPVDPTFQESCLPDTLYFLWRSAVAALELQRPSLLSYCTGTLQLRWEHQEATWIYEPLSKRLARLDGDLEEEREYSLFSRRRTSEPKAPRPRAVADEVVEQFLVWALDRGRTPTATEFPGPRSNWLGCIRHQLWQRRLTETGRDGIFDSSRKTLWENVLYQMGTALFQPGGRPPFKKWSDSFQADVRALFGSYAQACAESDSWMRRMGDPQYVESEIRGAGKGRTDPEKGLYFHISLLHEQPLVVQLLIALARQLGGADMPREVTVIRLSYNGDVVKFYDYENFDCPEPSPLRSFCKVMFRKRRVFGKDYPAGSRHKILEDKTSLTGALAGNSST